MGAKTAVTAKSAGTGTGLKMAEAAGLILTATAVGTVFWLRPPKVPPLPASAPRTGAIHYSWDFNSPGFPAEFKVDLGSWHYVTNGGPDGSGCMETDGLFFSALIDVPLESLPVLVSYRTSVFVNPKPEGGYLETVAWKPAGETVFFRGLSEHQKDSVGPTQERGSWHEVRDYMASDYLERWQDGRHISFTVNKLAPESRLKLYFRGRHRFDDLTIRSMAPGEIPDVKKIWTPWRRFPRRNGWGRSLSQISSPARTPGRSLPSSTPTTGRGGAVEMRLEQGKVPRTRLAAPRAGYREARLSS